MPGDGGLKCWLCDEPADNARTHRRHGPVCVCVDCAAVNRALESLPRQKAELAAMEDQQTRRRWYLTQGRVLRADRHGGEELQ
jgi:hypothetical protein